MEVKISAAEVKKLRQATGAGMMDCKKALIESEGDFEKAIEYLRKKGQKLSAKRADRDAKEGVVIAMVSEDAKKGVIVKLSCETDFVAKNEDFVNLTKKLADLALTEFPDNKADLLNKEFAGITVGEKITEQIGVIGEKLELASYEHLSAELVIPYIHMGYKAGVIVGFSKANDSFVEAGKDVAMQIAAMRPIAVDKDGVDSTVVEKEIEIGMEQARQEGKPEAMLERIAMGKLNKFYKENTLLSQAFVKNNKQNIDQYLRSVDPDLTVTEFKHIELG
jgi:elongation factor Ts